MDTWRGLRGLPIWRRRGKLYGSLGRLRFDGPHILQESILLCDDCDKVNHPSLAMSTADIGGRATICIV
jgi:hypothetical protein